MEYPWRKCWNLKCPHILQLGEKFCSDCGKEVTREQADTLRYESSLISKRTNLVTVPPLIVTIINFVVVLMEFLPKKFIWVNIAFIFLCLIWVVAVSFFVDERVRAKTFRYWQEALRQSKAKPI